MNEEEVSKWAKRPAKKRVLLSFSIPKTPKEAERELGLKKLKTRPYVEKGLLIPLNPVATKGRLYALTAKARKLLDLSHQGKTLAYSDWALIGWIRSSPLQRFVVMKTVDTVKRTSEELREKASKLNPHISRTSMKGILKALVGRGLVDTEMNRGKRYYWVNDNGSCFQKTV